MCAIGAIHPPPIEVGVFLHFLINNTHYVLCTQDIYWGYLVMSLCGGQMTEY